MSAAPQDVLAPSQLNTLARDLLESAFGQVWIEGELGGVSRPASGHLYFALKDARAQVRCALFKPKSQWLNFRPTDGMMVLARARVTLYEPRGEYQLIIDHLEEAGEGALRRAFESLKAQLAAEGLFDSERKRALPQQLSRLAILSSPSGAAVHDVLTVLRRRYPLMQIDVLPVPVQGPLAASQITTMLKAADVSARYDVILITRGGGSLEDLAAFNDEGLARAISACQTPVVSAIGHEIDYSICDFVADVRAPTPSAAAEILSRDGEQLLRHLARLREQLSQLIQARIERQWLRVDPLQHRLSIQRPSQRLERGKDRLQALQQRLQYSQQLHNHSAQTRINNLTIRLAAHHPKQRLKVMSQAANLAITRQQQLIRHQLHRDAGRLSSLGRALNAISPLATLQRGFAILLDTQGHNLRSASALKTNDIVTARLADGERQLRVIDGT